MAGTLLGAQLTDENRIWQAILGATVSASGLEMASLIDPENIAATFEEWLGQVLVLQQVAWQASTVQAAKYVQAYRAAEIGAVKAAQLPVVVPEFDLTAALDAVSWAPWQAQAAINRGTDPVWAWDAATRGYSSRLWREAMEGGRQVVSQSVKARGGRWRRVADGNPCAFCAMLVTRGPVYSETTVDFQSHAHCGCTVEEVFGEWQPTKQEQQWIDEYYSAHSPGMSVEETVARMRESGTGLFNDAANPKTQTGGAGGGGRPPSLPVAGGVWDDAERARRQAALGIYVPPGMLLEREEIEFCQRLLAHYPDVAPADVMRWLPLGEPDPTTGKRPPSYDFRWLVFDGRTYELKSPRSADYDAVKNRLKDDLGKDKTRFIVDLGYESATSELLRSLGRYKAIRGIDALIVMASNGKDLIMIA